MRWAWADGPLEPGFTAVVRVKDEARVAAVGAAAAAARREPRRARRQRLDRRHRRRRPPSRGGLRRGRPARGPAPTRSRSPAAAPSTSPRRRRPCTASRTSTTGRSRTCAPPTRSSGTATWSSPTPPSRRCATSPGSSRPPRRSSGSPATRSTSPTSAARSSTRLRNCEPWGWPNRPGYSFVKAIDWELPLWGGDAADHAARVVVRRAQAPRRRRVLALVAHRLRLVRPHPAQATRMGGLPGLAAGAPPPAGVVRDRGAVRPPRHRPRAHAWCRHARRLRPGADRRRPRRQRGVAAPRRRRARDGRRASGAGARSGAPGEPAAPAAPLRTWTAARERRTPRPEQLVQRYLGPERAARSPSDERDADAAPSLEQRRGRPAPQSDPSPHSATRSVPGTRRWPANRAHCVRTWTRTAPFER